MNDFMLTEGEKAHPLWLRLKAHWIDQLAELRVRNDDPSRPELDTAALRGQIKTLKTIIALGDERPALE